MVYYCLVGDLYLNGNLVPPSSDYYYEWFNDRTNPGNFVMVDNGWGIYHQHRSPDGHANQIYQMQVKIYDINLNFLASDIQPIGKGGTPKKINAFVKRADGSDLDGNYMKHYTNPHWRWVEVPNTDYFWLTLHAGEKLWTTTDIVSNPDEKYQYWLTTNDVTNYQQFYIDDNFTEIISKFNRIFKSTIQTDYYGTTDGFIRLKDPWYPDNAELGGIKQNRGADPIWHSNPSPLIIEPVQTDKYKGVFNGEQDPGYSIKVPSDTTTEINNKTLKWYFSQWATTNAVVENAFNNETAVFFTEDNSEIDAQYKGHLAANTASASAYNNGRRLIIDNSGVWHLVYADGGNIYYTTSSDNGSTWSDDLRLNKSEFMGNNFNPSIAYHSSQIGVVWERINDQGKHFPVFRYKDPSHWSAEIFADSDVNTTAECTPVVTHANVDDNPGFYILCKVNNYHTKVGIGLLYAESGVESTTLQWKGCLLYTGENSRYPSVTTAAGETAGSILYIAWEEDDMIYYSYYDGDFHGKEAVSYEADEGESNQKPSISYDGEDLVNVAWEFHGGSSHVKFEHRQRDLDGEWSDIQMIQSYDDLTAPSAGCFLSPAGKNLFAMNLGTDVRILQRYNGWSWFSFQEPGINPNLNVWGSDLMTVWTDNSEGLPFLVENELFPSEEEKSREPQQEFLVRCYRQERFVLDSLTTLNLKGKVRLKMGEVKVTTALGEETWDFVRLPFHTTNRPALQTQPLVITPSMQSLRLQYEVWLRGFRKLVQKPGMALFEIRLLDAATLQPVAHLKKLNFSGISQTNLTVSDSLIFNLRPFAGRKLVLQLQSVQHLYGTSAPQITEILDYRRNNNENVRFAKSGEISTVVEKQHPQSYQLYQNYPNPFNPSTTISFDLPEESRVRLEIYDITGRKIRTLAEGRYPAGTHRVVWDGTDSRGQAVASGVYAYRIRAGKHITTRKLLLMK